MKSSKNLSNRPLGGLRDMLISTVKPNLHKWEGDGVDHINLGMSRTQLGSLLSLGGISSFNHSELGRFKTLLGFWNYIGHEEGDDRYRILIDKEIRLFNLQRGVVRTPRRVKNFNAVILDAQWQRITGSEKIKKMLIESTLPFDCYRVNRSGMRERTSYEYWFVPALEEMRACLKEGRTFDVKPYMQFPDGDLYESIRVKPKAAPQATVIIEEMLETQGSDIIEFMYHGEAVDIITLISDKVSLLKPTPESILNYRIDAIYPTRLAVGDSVIHLNENKEASVVMFQPNEKITIQTEEFGEINLYSNAIGGFVVDGLPADLSVGVGCVVDYSYCIK